MPIRGGSARPGRRVRRIVLGFAHSVATRAGSGPMPLRRAAPASARPASPARAAGRPMASGLRLRPVRTPARAPTGASRRRTARSGAVFARSRCRSSASRPGSSGRSPSRSGGGSWARSGTSCSLTTLVRVRAKPTPAPGHPDSRAPHAQGAARSTAGVAPAAGSPAAAGISRATRAAAAGGRRRRSRRRSRCFRSARRHPP